MLKITMKKTFPTLKDTEGLDIERWENDGGRIINGH